MSEPMTKLLDSTLLLFDLQQVNELAQRFSGCLKPETIAHRVTDGLVEKFDCVFARLWLMEPDQSSLRLVASSGLYTHTDGFFANVPIGAYKVGKIAQNRVSFLSNHLPDEPWVGNRDWAIANHIQGFAGYPLVIQDKVIGVLAVFSHQPMASEFLEVLQTLCTVVTIALDTALQYQKEQRQSFLHRPSLKQLVLSEQLAHILSSTRLTLVGTEQPLTLPLAYIFLQAAETLNQAGCAYCRLIYTVDSITLEAIVPVTERVSPNPGWIQSALGEISFVISCLGGTLNTQTDVNQRTIHILLTIPYPSCSVGARIRIQCASPVLQMAFTHMAFWAGLVVCDVADETVPLLTDDAAAVQSARSVVWIQQEGHSTPHGVRAKVDLSTDPDQLRQAVEATMNGELWGIESGAETQLPLSDRELEMMTLLTQGMRDRDIANHLFISESTVKFHINNILTKLKARTRYQAVHQVVAKGWIQ